jgi:hypothetical protein
VFGAVMRESWAGSGEGEGRDRGRGEAFHVEISCRCLRWELSTSTAAINKY